MNRLKWALGLIFQNFWWKLLALVCAVLIWALVASEPELSTFATVPLEYRNIPDQLEISSRPVETVSLELRGPAGELRGPGDGRRPAVVIDMTGMMPGEHTFTIGNGNVMLPRAVSLVRAIPSEVRFDFERTLERRIPVQPRFTGNPAGYAIAQVTVTPMDLQIAGPASHVAKLQAAITDPVDVSPVVGTAQIRVNAFVSDPYVRFESSPQVIVTVTMKKK